MPEQLLAVLSRAMEYRRMAIENARYKRHLEDMVREKSAALVEALDATRKSYEFTLEALVAMLDAREHMTGQHSIRVRDMAVTLAQHMGIIGEELEVISHGALLHDIGKIAVPDAILRKPGSLTEEEWEVIKLHPDVGYKVIQNSTFLGEAAQIVRSHQERYDGTGYPQGLRGNEICVGARIFAVIDAYDAMRSDRYYRKGLAPEACIAEIAGERGKQFDPEVVDAFLQCQPAIENAREEAVHRKPKTDFSELEEKLSSQPVVQGQ